MPGQQALKKTCWENETTPKLNGDKWYQEAKLLN
jgi:hypothetical protein